MFEKFIKWLAKEYINFAYSSGYTVRQKEITDNREISLKHRIETSIDKKIIYCSNEWEDPLFGIVIGSTLVTKAQTPMLVVKNVMNGQMHVVDPTSYLDGDEQMVQAILKLNPFERWNLITGTNESCSNMWSKSYKPHSELTHPGVIYTKLREANFI